MARIVVVGAGIYGVTAAMELRRRQHDVTIVDPGPLPHPDAATTDITKMIRGDYGSDALYAELMDLCFEGWRTWNASWPRQLFHESGFLVISPGPLESEAYEGASYATLLRRGHLLSKMTATDLSKSFPAWRIPPEAEAYHNPIGGWAESGAVLEQLLVGAFASGIAHVAARVVGISERTNGTAGVSTADGQTITGDTVVVAAGAWTPSLLPELADRMWAVGQPVLHFAPSDPELFAMPRFSPWSYDIGRTGWYGFALTAGGVVKVANHGPGSRIHPDDARTLDPTWEARFRAFFRDHLPPLADAPVVGSRLCLYCDTFDGDFWIDRHPERPGVVVSSGGSGHGFKFAPILGQLTADAVEGVDNSLGERFRWRPLGRLHSEDARFIGDA